MESRRTKRKITSQINDANKQLTNGELEKNFQEQINQIDSNTNIEDYKYKLYTQKTLTNLAKDMSYQSYQEEYKTNPYSQINMEKKRLQVEYDKMRQSESHFQQNLNWDKTKTMLDLQFKEKQKEGSDLITTDKAITTNVNAPDLNDLHKDIVNITGEDIRTPTGVIHTPGKIDLLNNKYIDLVTNPSLTVYKSNGEIDTQKTGERKTTYLNYLSARYAEDPSKLTKALHNPNLVEYLENRRALEIQAGQKQQLALSAKNEASKMGFDTKQEELLKNTPGITLHNGQPLYSAKELYDFASDSSKFYSYYSNSQTMAGLSPGPQSKQLKVKELLSKYAGTKFEPLAKSLVAKETGTPMSSTAKQLLESINRVTNIVSPQLNKINEDKNKFISEYLAKRMPERQSQVATFDYKNNQIDQSNIDKLIGNKTEEFSTMGQLDNKEWKDFNPDTLSKIREDKNASYTLEKNYDGSANLLVTSGKVVQNIPITSSELNRFFPKASITNPWESIKYDILSSPAHTTNLKGGQDGSNATNSKLTGYNAPHLLNTPLAPLVRFDVEGNPNNSGDTDTDKYILRMYVNDNGVWKTDYVGNRFVSLGDVQTQVGSVTPTVISSFLKTHK